MQRNQNKQETEENNEKIEVNYVSQLFLFLILSSRWYMVTL